MSIYSNDNIRKIAKLTTRELPQKSKNAKITVRENNGLYSIALPWEYSFFFFMEEWEWTGSYDIMTREWISVTGN